MFLLVMTGACVLSILFLLTDFQAWHNTPAQIRTALMATLNKLILNAGATLVLVTYESGIDSCVVPVHGSDANGSVTENQHWLQFGDKDRAELNAILLWLDPRGRALRSAFHLQARSGRGRIVKMRRSGFTILSRPTPPPPSFVLKSITKLQK